MKNNSPKISIIIPIYNSEKYLDDCLNSLLAQTYQNLEIILINDGSKDGSLNICHRFADNDERFVIIDKVNTGVSDSRNQGISTASGNYITFLDSDDWVEPTFVSDMYENLIGNNADISICNWFRHSRQIKKTSQVRKVTVETCSGFDVIKGIFTATKFMGYSCNKLFKKDILGDLRFDTKTHYQEDMIFCYHYLKKCKTAVFTNKKLYHYIKTPKSIGSFHFSPKKLTVIEGMREIMEDSRLYYHEAEPYITGWFYLCNLELLYYAIRQKPKDPDLIDTLKNNIISSNSAYLKIRKECDFFRSKANILYDLLKHF